MPGHDGRPRLRPSRRGGASQPPPRQTVAADPLGQLVQRPQQRAVRRATTGTVDLLLGGHRLDVGQAGRPRGQGTGRVHQRPAPMADREEPGPGTTSARSAVSPSRSASSRGSTGPAWATVPAPPTPTDNPCDHASAGSTSGRRLPVAFTSKVSLPGVMQVYAICILPGQGHLSRFRHR